MSREENIKSLPDTDEHYIYLVWGIGKGADGSHIDILYAVDTTREKADRHKAMAERKKSELGYPKISRIHIEKRWTNHYFGQSLPIWCA